MFRKKPRPPLKEIEEWPTTLDGYGLFISEKDQVRLIVRPEDKMVYKLTNSREYNDRRLSAFRRPIPPPQLELIIGVLSNIAVERLEKLGFRKLIVPLGTPVEEPHTAVLVSGDFETNKEKLAVLVPYADELGMWACRVMDEETIHAGSLEDAAKTLLETGYAIIALNPKQNWWDPVRKTHLSFTESRYSKRKFTKVPGIQPLTDGIEQIGNGESALHIRYVMDNVVPLSRASEIYIFAHWGSCWELLEYLNSTYDEKWDGKIKALGMAQGTFPMEEVTSAKFRIFLAEKAVNYSYMANVKAKILVTNTNIGCPNISFGPGCDMYEYMATRTLEKVIRFFEGGQAAILGETVVDEPEPEGEEAELDELGNWDDLREKIIQSGDMERLLQIGIGTGADDSEWFRHK